MNNKHTNFIISLIGIFVFMHYFFTMNVLWKYLSGYNLNIVSIFSWEDIQFSVASINSEMFIPISVILLMIFFLIEHFIAIVNKKEIGFKAVRRRRNHYTLRIFLVIAMGLFVVGQYFLQGLIFALLSVLLFFAMYAYYKYRNTAIVLLSFVFIFTKVLYDDIIKEGSRLYTNDIKIELDDGRIVQSDSINKLVFFGTKYIILENDSPNVKLYPTNRIKEIEWINKKKSNHTDTIKAAS